MTFRVAASAIGLAVLATYIVGSGYWVQTSGAWYGSLQRPAWQPPDWVFGVAWPYNFTVLAVAVVMLPRRLSQPSAVWWLALFAASVVAALVWSQQFYVPHNLVAAAVALASAAVLTVPMVALAWRGSAGISLALVPYQLWLFTATSLSMGYALKN